MLSTISFNETKEIKEYVEHQLDNYNNGKQIKPTDFIFIGILIIILSVQIASYIRILKSPLYNVISFFDFSTIKVKREIEAILIELLVLSNADRVTVGLFHNGSSIGLIHFKEMSVLYQACKVGVDKVKFKKIDLDVLEDELESLSKAPNFYTKYSRTDKDINSDCAAYLDNYNIKTVISKLIIIGKKNRGIIQFQFFNNNDDNFNTNLEIERLFNRLTVKLKTVLR